MASIGSPEGNGDRGKFIFGLDEDAAILGKFAAQQFHDTRPWSDGIACSVAHSRGDQSQSKHGVAIGRDALGVGRFSRRKAELAEVGGLEGVACIEGVHAVTQDVLTLAAKLTLDDADELFPVEMEHGAEESQHENVLAAILGGSADGFHGG